MRRTIFEPEHDDFRESVRRFIAEEITPHNAEWEQAGIVPRELFAKAASKGMLALAVPERYGGLGIEDFRFNQVMIEELAHAGITGAGVGLTFHSDSGAAYFLRHASEEQRERWLPGIASGELITALAITEPDSGSDVASMVTTALPRNGGYVVNGTKTFITNGLNSDLVILAAKTDPEQSHRGISLLVVERGMEGFERGRKLDKLGQRAQDTAELHFHDVHVPRANLLGQEGQGFKGLLQGLPGERLGVAIAGLSAARAALDWTLEYVKERTAFGQPIGSFQHSRFVLAEMATEIDLATVYCDQAVLALNAGELAGEDAAKAKWWCTELQGRVVDRCVQLHGGYGYMLEYPITRAYADARASRIYVGSTEIMKEIIGRSLGV